MVDPLTYFHSGQCSATGSFKFSQNEKINISIVPVSTSAGFSLIPKYGECIDSRKNMEGPKYNLGSPLCIMRSQHLK